MQGCSKAPCFCPLTAAVTNSSRCSGLQCNCVAFEFWRSQGWDGCHRAAICVSGAMLLLETLEEKPFPHLFQLLEATHVLWLLASSSVRQPRNGGWSPYVTQP